MRAERTMQRGRMGWWSDGDVSVECMVVMEVEGRGGTEE